MINEIETRIEEKKKAKRIGEVDFYECAACRRVCAYNKENYPYCKRCKEEQR